MADADEVTPTPRVTNGTISHELKEQGIALAVLAEQSKAMLDLLREVQAQMKQASNRQDGLDRQVLTLEGRVDLLQARPIGPTPEQQGENRSAIKEHEADIQHIKTAVHDHGNAIQTLKARPTSAFTPEEAAELKRLLGVASREPEVMADLRRMREEWRNTGSRRIQMRDILLVNFIGLIGSGFVFGYCVPAIQHIPHG